MTHTNPLSTILKGFTVFFSNLPLFFRLVWIPILIGTAVDVGVSHVLKDCEAVPLLYVGLALKMITYFFFDILFDITIFRFAAGQALGASYQGLTFGGTGWRTFGVNVKYFILTVIFWAPVGIGLFHLSGLSDEKAFPAYWQHANDASVLPPEIHTLIESNIYLTGVLLLIALLVYLLINIRFCMAEPAAALGEKDATLMGAFKKTKGHTFYVAMVALLLTPLFLGSSYLQTQTTPLMEKVTQESLQENTLLTKIILKEFNLPTQVKEELTEEETQPSDAQKLRDPLFIIGAKVLSNILEKLVQYLFSFFAGLVLTYAYQAITQKSKKIKKDA